MGCGIEKMANPRFAFIGVGGRGHGLLGEMLAVEGANGVNLNPLVLT